jgi:hypothetical protein
MKYVFFLVIVLIDSFAFQNIAVRKYLERRAKEKEQDDREKQEQEKIKAEEAANQLASQQALTSLLLTSSLIPSSSKDDSSVSSKKSKSNRFWGRSRKKDAEDNEEEINEAELFHSPRPAFFAHTRPTRRTQVPRDVAVPYFRFRKDRFYDWPPDPTVSRATPLLTTSRDAQSEFDNMDGSTHHKKRRDEVDDKEDPDDRPHGVRKRTKSKSKKEDPYRY